jgi:DNA helicase-2/ATP-dependent DNA helicase PcrA
VGKSFTRYLKMNCGIDLNEQQIAAVLHKDGPACTIAVPGAGKTTMMVCRTANLILSHGIKSGKYSVCYF